MATRLNVKYRKIDSLRAYKRNARTHSKKQIKQLAASIKEFGFINPLLITRDGEIIAGHGRWEAAKLAGLSEVPTIVIDYLTTEQRRAYILADNKLALNAGWDTELLALELGELADLGFGELAGFSTTEIDLVLDGARAADAEREELAPEDAHTGRFDAFCIVSSDGDFTRLAARIREQGLDVFGFGQLKTPESFRKACKRFIFTENLVAADTIRPLKTAGEESMEESPTKQSPSNALPHISSALSQLEELDGWYALAAVGGRLAALMPDFDPRTYGCAKLVTLVERSEVFEVRRDNLKVFIRPRKIAFSATPGILRLPPTQCAPRPRVGASAGLQLSRRASA